MTSEKQTRPENRARPTTDELREFISTDWAPRDTTPTPRAEVADHAAVRRAAVSAAYPGERIVVPAGGLKIRSNDSDYRFRPHSAFVHLTGLGADREPDAVLVLEPRGDGDGHDAVLFFKPDPGRDTDEFFTDARYGEFWVGPTPTLADIESELGLVTRHIDELTDALAKDAGEVALRVVRDADVDVTRAVDDARQTEGSTDEQVLAALDADQELARRLSNLRMVKDAWEAQQMRDAVAATKVGFEAVIATLREAVEKGRGERWVEGMFGLHARHEGNGIGYDSICASGDHATTLHWIRNTGEVREGDVLLLDAGVEVESLFTADVTRSLPVSGTFTDAQREIYDAVYAAQEAGIAAAVPGNRFSDIHAASTRVIAEHLVRWGLMPEGLTVDDVLDKDHGMQYRRWMCHGTSHHLGIDVHDCALATREEYMDAELLPGMVLTVEPGLYFKADDLKAPERFRGTGIRIEDDILITEDGNENLSASMPRTADEVEAWIAQIQG